MIYGNVSMKDAQNAYGGSLSAGAENAIKRTPELPAAIDGMDRACNYLHDQVNNLSSRLDGVLRPAGPEPAQATKIEPAAPASGYACTIHGQAARIEALSERIHDLLRRLEA